jgi:exosortase
MFERLQESQKHFLWALLLLAVVFGRMLVEIFSWLWSREHYQFFPFIWIGFVAFAYYRLKEKPVELRWEFTLRTAIYGLMALLITGLAIWTGSPWLGLIGFLVSLWTLIWLSGGVALARELRGPMAFLCLTIPLPLDLDLLAITQLQEHAARFSSGLLDLSHIRHYISGVAFQTIHRSYMVEEACSGIHSLFSAITTTMAIAVLWRFGFLRTVTVLSFAIFWVVVANAFRVWVIIIANEKFGILLDEGLRHEIVGVVTYAFAILATLSSERLLRYVFPMRTKGITEDAPRTFRSMRRSWKNVNEKVLGRRLAAAGSSTRRLLIAVAGIFAILLSADLLKNASFAGDHAPTDIFAEQTLTSVREEVLPKTIDHWVRTGWESVVRDKVDPLGVHSTVWTYQSGGLEALISLDGNYADWHDLAYCYRGLGWKLKDSANSLERVEEIEIPHTELSLYQASGSRATILFTCIDSQGAPVTPAEPSGSLLRTLKNRIMAGVGIGVAKHAVAPPVFQVQAACISQRELLPEEMLAVRELFFKAREVLRKPIAPQIGGGE